VLGGRCGLQLIEGVGGVVTAVAEPSHGQGEKQLRASRQWSGKSWSDAPIVKGIGDRGHRQ
jgi:hypothetical protein